MAETTLRDATDADRPALTALREPLALHRDRVRDAGGDELWIAVDPEEDPRAQVLHERLGFVAADGNVHEGRHWNLDLVRRL